MILTNMGELCKHTMAPALLSRSLKGAPADHSICVLARRGTPCAVSVPSRVEAPLTRAALMRFLRFEGRGLLGSRLQPYIDHTPSSVLMSTQIHSNALSHVK